MIRLKLVGIGFLWAQLNGTYLINGTSSANSFPTIKAAFDALNAQGINGDVTLIISTGYDPNTESPAQLSPFVGMGAYEVKLTVDPNLGMVTIPTSPITGNRYVLRLNGIRRFVLDGKGKLRFQVANPITSSCVIGLLATTGNRLDSVYIRDCIIDGGSSTTTFAGIYMGGVSIPSNAASAPNQRIFLETNTIYGVRNGIYLRSASGASDFATVIQGNKIGHPQASTSWGGANNSAGIFLSGQDSLLIENNTIFNAVSSTYHSCRGIQLSTTSHPNSRVYVRKNFIHSIKHTGTASGGAYGIYVQVPSVGPSRIYLHNNMIADILANGGSTPGYGDNAYGIYLTGSSTTNAGIYVDFNSIHLFGTPTQAATSANPACLGVNSITGGVYVRSNLFQNTQTPRASSSRRTIIYGFTTNPAPFADLNNNVYYVAANTSTPAAPIVGIAARGSTVYPTLPSWQTYTGKDASAQVLDLPAPFVSDTDLHIPDGTATPIEGAGTVVLVPPITDDYDSQPRNSSTPDAGCDEFNGNPPTCPPSFYAGGTFTISEDTVTRGDNITLSVSNPSTVTQPAYWQVSTNRTTWQNLTLFSTHPYSYTTLTAGKLYFRLYARSPAYCSLTPDSTNVDSVVVLPPGGDNATFPFTLNATCSQADTVQVDLSQDWADDYTGYRDRTGSVPDVFYRYILTECLDSLKVNMCQSSMTNPDIIVWNTTKNQRVYSDGWSCGSTGSRPQFTLVHGNINPGVNAAVTSGPTATAPMKLEAGDTLLFVIMPFSTTTTLGAIELIVTPFCADSTLTPSLPNDTALCFSGSPIDLEISSGLSGSGYTFEWYRNGNLLPGTNILSSITQTFNQPGSYQIVCKVRAGFCAPLNADTLYITVYGLPDVSIIVNATTYPTSYDEVNVGQAPQTVTFQVDETTSPNPSQNVYTWTIQGNIQTGAGPIIVTYTSPTRDTVILRTTYGPCEESDTIVVIVDPSTALNIGNETFTLYPNPSAGTFYLHSTLQGPATVQLLDLSGRIAWETTVSLSGSPTSLAVPVSNGLYQLRLLTPSGKLLQKPLSVLR
ncbi:MAG: T9SS type A sorting domain-containing protein [Bacteroidia bacterium]